MKALFSASTLLLAVASSPVAAVPDVDAAQCDRIVDVTVPYEVDVTEDGLRFNGDGASIVVTSQQIQFRDQVFRDAAVRDYYDALTSFLGNASSMANVAKSFSRRGAFPQAATDMCLAVLSVHQSGEAMQQLFHGFTTPVRVQLK